MVKVHQSIIDENSCSDISKALKHRSKPDIYYLLMSNVYTCSSDNSFQAHVTKRCCEKGTYIFDKQQVLYEVGDHHTVFAGWISSDFSSSSVDSSRFAHAANLFSVTLCGADIYLKARDQHKETEKPPPAAQDGAPDMLPKI